MRSDYACRLARAAQVRDDITVLPGVEISCQAPPSYGNCIHLLAVFPPEADAAVIESVSAGQNLAGPTQRWGDETVRFHGGSMPAAATLPANRGFSDRMLFK
jgi:hypothetical protein